jgi:UDP-N-acetylglucosamine diphosphorylase/glucosamine-1-phosphate N-acetyltransferase
MRFYLFDSPAILDHLWPFTLSRSVSDIPVGMFTLRQKWEGYAPGAVIDSLNEQSAANTLGLNEPNTPFLAVASHCFPSAGLYAQLSSMKPGQTLWQGDTLLAVFAESPIQFTEAIKGTTRLDAIPAELPIDLLDRIWKIPELIGPEIAKDLPMKGHTKTAIEKDWGNLIIGPVDRLHLAEGAKIFGSIINTTQGDVFLDSDSEVMEGCMIRGPFYLGPHSVLKMGTRIYGPVATGKYVKLGGEINQSQIFDFSNKGHEGYLGNSVIGSWCNLGADTNNSNLKNNYAEVKLWNQALNTFENTGLQFCGLFMGDHSKTGINTMFNTGTVVGFSCNIFGSGFPRNVVPSFKWGGASGVIPYKLEAAKETAKAMMARRKIPFDEGQEALFQRIFENKQ